jgi:hypothetical protein
MWVNWGVGWPIQCVTFAVQRREGVKPVAVFRFLSEDWSPWIALLRMRERWPELRFTMKVSYYGWADDRGKTADVRELTISA